MIYDSREPDADRSAETSHRINGPPLLDQGQREKDRFSVGRENVRPFMHLGEKTVVVFLGNGRGKKHKGLISDGIVRGRPFTRALRQRKWALSARSDLVHEGREIAEWRT